MKSLLYKLGILAFLSLVVYSRFINIGWGLPYPMHPDERNMADAITRLTCLNYFAISKELINALWHGQELIVKNTSCANPQFFAYGQFTLYLAYAFGTHFNSQLNTFENAILALRFIAATSSLLTVFFGYKIAKLIAKDFGINLSKIAILPIAFYPSAIAYAHFGTTESVLTLFFTMLVYTAILFLDKKISFVKFSLLQGLILGLSLATKFSAVTFVSIYLFVVFYSFVQYLIVLSQNINFLTKHKQLLHQTFVAIIASLTVKNLKTSLVAIVIFAIFIIFVTLLGSPYNVIAWPQFLGSIAYEGSVGYGQYIPFYTRQFLLESPLFVVTKIYPYALGAITALTFLISFFALDFKSKKINLLRFAFIATTLPNILLYAKWTRFVSAPFTICAVLAVLIVVRTFKKINISKISILFFIIMALPGFAYISVYAKTDVRLQASAWIYKNVKTDSFILQETANVVDLPISSVKDNILPPQNHMLKGVPFDLYNVDIQPKLQQELTDSIAKANYIIVPSRRIFYNHTCLAPSGMTRSTNASKCKYLESKYPQVNAYYNMLFDKNKYKEVANFTSYPSVNIFGKTILDFADEQAEETFTVFDHPVIRVYKKI